MEFQYLRPPFRLAFLYSSVAVLLPVNSNDGLGRRYFLLKINFKSEPEVDIKDAETSASAKRVSFTNL